VLGVLSGNAKHQLGEVIGEGIDCALALKKIKASNIIGIIALNRLF